MNAKSRAIGPIDRAVYDLAEAGALDAAHAVLYPRSIGKLIRAGLIARLADGTYAAVRAATDRRQSSAPPSGAIAAPRVAPTPTPRGPAMTSLVVRVPQEWIDMLDARGPDRSTALREVLGRALAAESGTRKVGS